MALKAAVEAVRGGASGTVIERVLSLRPFWECISSRRVVFCKVDGKMTRQENLKLGRQQRNASGLFQPYRVLSVRGVQGPRVSSSSTLADVTVYDSTSVFPKSLCQWLALLPEASITLRSCESREFGL